MGIIAEQIRKNLTRTKHRYLFHNEELQALLENFKQNWQSAMNIPERWGGELHPVFTLCTTTQNMVSIIAELLSTLRPMKEWVSNVIQTEDEYSPHGPPISPITASFFSYWSLFDLPVGKDNETLGIIASELSDSIGLPEDAARTIKEMQKTRMGVYEFLGSEDEYVLLKEVITGKQYKCWVASGYSPSVKSSNLLREMGCPDVRKELWFVRIFPGSSINCDISVVLNTPYILILPGAEAWFEFIQRTFQSNNTKISLPYESFMKFGLSHRYWLEYVFQAYSSHLHDAVFITGIPDIPHSLPHSSGVLGL
ncbi:MAG: hypothetical protein K0R28_301 [Paenibacillus sp.]|jgi:hypothetical protein|nr:hypothetical protein [Paenibacillus sp.]